MTSDSHLSLSVPPGIALYPGQAQLLSCRHHYEVIPPLRGPGQPGDMNCTTQKINYSDPFSNQTLVTHLSELGLGSTPCQPRAPRAAFFLPGCFLNSLGAGPQLPANTRLS